MRGKGLGSRFCLFFMIIALSSSIIAGEKTAASSWASEPVKIDASENEWNAESLAVEEKLSIQYGFRNNEENLFVLFIFQDLDKMTSLMQTGITLWFDTAGTTKKEYGIRFKSMMLPTDAYIGLLEKQLGPLPEPMKAQLRTKKSHLVYHSQVIDKKSEIDVISTGPFAPQFKSRMTKETAVFEFRIPLKKVKGQVIGIGTEPGKSLNVGFEWGGMTKEMKADVMAKRAAMSKVSDFDTSVSSDISKERDGVMGSGDIPFRFQRGTTKYSSWVNVSLAQK